MKLGRRRWDRRRKWIPWSSWISMESMGIHGFQKVERRGTTPTHGTIDGRHHRDLHERPPIRHTTTPIHDQSRDDTRPPGESRPREQRHTQDRLISLSASPPQSICHTALPENVTPRGAMIAARDAALDAAVKKQRIKPKRQLEPKWLRTGVSFSI